MIPQDEIEKERIRTGDIGLTAESLIERKKQATLFHEPLTVQRIYSNEMAQIGIKNNILPPPMLN